jgi:hypothetical protein
MSELIIPTAVRSAPAFVAGFLTPRGGIVGAIGGSSFLAVMHVAAAKNGEE